jgi:hypothetical protein
MDVVVRLLLRFLLVPLGYVAAVIAGTLVIVFGAWRLGAIDASAYPEAAFVGMVAGPILAAVLLATMWLPASIGILISEVFAIRSWIFHAANGAASAWAGWHLFGAIDDSPLPLHEPLHVIAAGIAGGFAYWAVAGFSAGFWLPVFRRPTLATDMTLATRR